MAKSFEIEDLSPNPSGYTSYSPEQQKDLAAFIKQCRVDKKNLNDTRDAYDNCSAQLSNELQFWQKPEGAILSAISILMVGIVAGSQMNGR